MRFSLIILLFFAMLGCGKDSTPATATEPFDVQDQAIAAIQEMGGSVAIDETNPNKPVVGVNFVGTKVTDDGLEHLKVLTSLKTLYLINTNVTDDGVKKLQTALPNCEIVR